ncbi:MAG: tRNA-uridine aminocarboxypropyltransferase [Myxococcota bacterium]
MNCPTCRKPTEVCVCDRVAPRVTGLSVVVLQHPQEQDRILGTVPLLEAAIGARRAVGLSWPNLRAALTGAGVEPDGDGSWAVIWPSQLPRELTPPELAAPVVRVGSDRPLRGLVALDGTWSQAKALWWRNPWLVKLDRIVLHPSQPSIYGRLRREPRAQFVSTLEAVAEALVGSGEAPEVREDLRRLMRTMTQRARDVPDAG